MACNDVIAQVDCCHPCRATSQTRYYFSCRATLQCSSNYMIDKIFSRVMIWYKGIVAQLQWHCCCASQRMMTCWVSQRCGHTDRLVHLSLQSLQSLVLFVASEGQMTETISDHLRRVIPRHLQGLTRCSAGTLSLL